MQQAKEESKVLSLNQNHDTNVQAAASRAEAEAVARGEQPQLYARPQQFAGQRT